MFQMHNCPRNYLRYFPLRSAVNSAGRSILPASGAALLHMQGLVFGYFSISAATRMGQTSSESAFWNSDSMMTCKNRGFAGPSSSITALVSVASERSWQQVGSLSGAISYQRPVVSASSPASVETSGVNSVTISGYDFAVQDRTARIRFLLSSVLSSLWRSDSSVRAKLARGTGDISLVVVSYEREATLSTVAVSYSSAVISATSRVNQPATGSSSILLAGAFLGNSAYSLRLRIGSSTSARDSSGILIHRSVLSLLVEMGDTLI